MAVMTVSPESRQRDMAPVHAAFTLDSPTPVRGAAAPADLVSVDHHPTVEISFAGHGDEDQTITFALWAVREVGDQRELYPLGTGTATLGAVTAGAATVYQGARLADEIAYTPSAYADYLSSLTGRGHALYPPAPPGDGTLAVIGIPDLGGLVAGLVVEITGGTATDAQAFAGFWT